MKTGIKGALAGLLGLAFVFCLAPGAARAEDESLGNTILIKDARIVNMTQRYIVVRKMGNYWNLDLAQADPEKTEILSKYGIQVLPTELRLGDRLSFKARDLGHGFAIPNHMYLGKGSHEYHKKHGYMCAEFVQYAGADLIAVAHSRSAATGAVIVDIHGDRITWHGDRVHTLKNHWQLLMKGTYDVHDKIFHKIEKTIKIQEKDKELSPNPFDIEND